MADVYTTDKLPYPPPVSKTTIPMIGLLVDVYGLEEVPPSAPLTALWLLHPRTRSKSHMHDIAARVLHAWHERGPAASEKRGLIALCFDQPNHGSRVVSEEANRAWNKGNARHAIDMVGMVKGGVTDMRSLMDLAGGYLELEGRIDGNVVLGWSLGGHGAWQSLFVEERMDAGVVVVGCPDLMGLMRDRAAGSKLSFGTEFLGSNHFPQDLIAACQKHDPKGILFGTLPLPAVPLSTSEQERILPLLDQTIRGKKILCLFGKDDKLVPYANSAGFLELMEDAAKTWYEGGGVRLEHSVYEGVGHAFSAPMVEEAVKFLVQVVEEGPRDRRDESQKANMCVPLDQS